MNNEMQSIQYMQSVKLDAIICEVLPRQNLEKTGEKDLEGKKGVFWV